MSLNYRHAGYYWYLFRTGHFFDPILFRIYGSVRNWQIEATSPVETAPVAEQFTDAEPSVVVCMLGRRHLSDGLYALKSFVVNYPEPVQLVLMEDGSFDPSTVARARHHLPQAWVWTKSDRDRVIERYLGAAGLIRCREFRQSLPLAARLIDCSIMFGQSGYFILDTDTVALRPLTELHAAVAANHMRTFVFGRDFQSAYCHQPDKLRGFPHPLAGVNAGLAHIPAGRIDLGELEQLLATGAVPLHHWWAEQTVFAILAAKHGAVMLPDWVYGIGLRRDERVNEVVHYCGDHAGPIRVALRRVGQGLALRTLRRVGRGKS